MLSPLILTAVDKELLGTANRSDAMGVLAVWSARGRDLVPHLTEQTTQVRGFQILIEAFRLWELYEPAHPDHAGRLSDFFILLEQAFARIVGHHDEAWPLPGSRRVRARLGETPFISVEDSSDWHLMNAQKGNGIWGLYRGAARRAGLLTEDMTSLSARTREAAYQSPCLGPNAQRKFFALAARALDGETVPLPTHGGNALVKDIYNSFDELPLAEHLQIMLVDGHPLNQSLARRLTQGRLTQDLVNQGGPLNWRPFLQEATRDLDEHRATLEHVQRCEDLLSVVEAVFEWLCASKGETLDEAGSELPVDLAALEHARVAFRDSGHYLGSTAQARKERVSHLLDTSSKPALARSVLVLHEKVSEERARAAWVWEEDGRLRSDVDFKRPDAEAFRVSQTWRNDYYLYPLWEIATQLKEVLGEQ